MSVERIDPSVSAINPDIEVGPRTGALFQYLDPILTRRNLFLDDAQLQALHRLQRLYDELVEFGVARRSALRRWVAPPTPPRGIYFYGGVGRGKSFLMDSFYACSKVRRKTRIHFHAFMRSVHEELKGLKSEEDPLCAVADRIVGRYRLICFDEFHVSDIADAMILGRLLSFLLDGGAVFCMTSNYHPDNLYPDGLQRQNFVGTIALLKERLDVIEVDGGIDYRLRALEHMPTYHTPITRETDLALAAAFDRMSDCGSEEAELEIEGRTFTARRRAGGIVWFDFSMLCDGPRSQVDYLELARTFNTVILSDVPKLKPDQADQARRFTWLVDIFYDHQVKLIISAQAPAEKLYQEGIGSREFARTVSRLIEMRTREYIAKPHMVT